jgi:hypothetical protein
MGVLPGGSRDELGDDVLAANTMGANIYARAK